MTKLQQLLSDQNPASWEAAFKNFVEHGNTPTDEWLWEWLWFRIKWNDDGFSLFALGNTPVQTRLKGLNIVVTVGDNQKKRYVAVKIYESNPYHPDFDEMVQVSDKEWRFPSVGNPYIDEPMYKIWEKWLFCKLLNIAFEERGGMAFLIEQMHKNG
jgi:hypothetical protein